MVQLRWTTVEVSRASSAAQVTRCEARLSSGVVLTDPARLPILARPLVRTPPVALLARPRWSQGIGAGARYRCCPDRAGMAGSGRSSTLHKPATGSPTDRFQVPGQKGQADNAS